MKKILYSLLTLAAALTVASCQKEPANPDPIFGGKTVETTFTVALDELPTKTYADGATADKLFVLVYGADGLVESQSLTTSTDAIQITGLKASYKVKFVKGQTYDIVFWAQAEDAPFSLDADTGKLTIETTGPANDETRDAFWYVERGYVANANDAATVTLKRPFAQINVLLADEFEEGTLSEMTVAGAPNVLDLLTGEASGEEDYSFTEAGLEDATFNKKYASGKNYAYAGMNYVLAPKDETLSTEVTFKVTCISEALGTIEIDKAVSGVPVKRNYRTNITYSPTTSKDYNVIIAPGMDGSHDDISADAEANAFTVQVGGSEFANNATLTMAPNETVNVTITDANGHTPDSAESTDETVVTVEEAQGGYEMSALKKGSADINFHIDGYTKQDVQGADFTIKVNVPGDPVLESIAVDTKNATTTFALNGTFTSEGIVVTATYDEGDPKDVTASATVTAPDMSTAGEKTVTVSYTEGGVTKEATYTITVEGETPPVAATLTGITVDASAATTTFTVGDTFTSEGIKVTATYSDESTKDVTAAATVTAPDMTTAGENKEVTVSYTEGDITKTATYTIMVNEGETPPSGAIVATVAEFLAAEESETQTYQLTGVITNISSNVYGNLDLKDETGTVYVYGVFPEQCEYGATNPKSFGDLGLKVGDELTLIGYRGSHNNSPQAVYSYYVSHKTAATISLAATETELPVGGTFNLNVQTNGGQITYKSSDEAVASVTTGGVITGVAVGTATITVSVAASGNLIGNTATCTVTVNPAGSTVVWVKKNLSDLKDGDIFVLTSVKTGEEFYAMTNNNGTSSAPGAVAVTVASDKLSDTPETKLQWIAGVSSDGIVFYTSSEKTAWLYCTNANNGLRVGTNANKAFEIDSESGYLKHVAETRFVGVYNNSDWRSYATVNNNIKDQTFNVFVKTTTTD
ncbi:MAG: bacterial Ig-like domain-containing protein [Bacteroidales bacterium]|nr:bacterial Ig-like domain-containing protein [Bacteroidales bacterium]